MRKRLTQLLSESKYLNSFVVRRCLMSSKSMDPEQLKYLDERCLLVDNNDTVIGTATKKLCHSWENINNKGMLHRAFSVFLFNENNELLLQQRSAAKITFAGMWTNTCCSHPLDTPNERLGIQGVKEAAVRKLNHELGIRIGDVVPEEMHYLTRLHYQAQANNQWGEHEIDYVLIARTNNIKIEPNPNEVSSTCYVTPKQLNAMIADSSNKFTPWFLLICHSWLQKWWSNLDNLISLYDHDTIHRFSK